MTIELRKLCRLCANVCALFDIDIFCYDGRINLAEAVLKYISIKITADDTLPVHICQSCKTVLTTFDEYAAKCRRIQISLNTLAEQDIVIDETLLETLKDECKDEDLTKVVKQEISDDVQIKFEQDSDYFNEDNEDNDDHEDLLPISHHISKKKTRKKKSKSGDSKRKKLKKSLTIKIKKDGDEIEKLITEDSLESGLAEVKSEQILADDAELPKRKRRNVITNNSFIKFVCHICSLEFPNWCALKNHTKKAHSEKAKILCMCDKYLFTRHSINRHIIKHDINAGGLKCSSCSKVFSTEKALEIHMPFHLPKEEYAHVCSHCAKRFASAFTLKIHEKTHIPKELRYIHPCEICSVKFTSKSSVKAHINAVHHKNRPFVCDVCGRAFTNKGNLQEHRVLHSEEKMHCCTQCPKKFKTKGTLQRHIDCHNGTAYKCPQCPALLNSRRTLRMHMYVHEDLCRYICAFCNKGYKRRKSLKSHMNLHTGERPFSCPWCSRTFADNSNCRIHKKRMHPIELAEYEALHGISQEAVMTDFTEKRVIYNTTFKRKDVTPVIVPHILINPTCEPVLQ